MDWRIHMPHIYFMQSQIGSFFRVWFPVATLPHSCCLAFSEKVPFDQVPEAVRDNPAEWFLEFYRNRLKRNDGSVRFAGSLSPLTLSGREFGDIPYINSESRIELNQLVNESFYSVLGFNNFTSRRTNCMSGAELDLLRQSVLTGSKFKVEWHTKENIMVIPEIKCGSGTEVVWA